MAFTDGRRSRFRIADTGGVMRDLSAYITEVSGLPGERTLNEVTALGDTGARFKPGAEAVQFTCADCSTTRRTRARMPFWGR